MRRQIRAKKKGQKKTQQLYNGCKSSFLFVTYVFATIFGWVWPLLSLTRCTTGTLHSQNLLFVGQLWMVSCNRSSISNVPSFDAVHRWSGTRYFLALITTVLCYLWMVGSKEHVVPISECCEHQIDVLLVVNVSMVLTIYSQFFWLLTLVVCGP